ncbi:MAG TPA: Rid family hydrolase [Acidimicrobiia bacterium]|nr:Rid family hydrolase [Acidimicrobiia bacterium]
MTDLFEYVHTEGNEPRFNMPYTPAIKVTNGRIVYLAGVTAAPVYHSHPHIASEFDDIPLDPEEQTEMCVENLRVVVEAAGGSLGTIVEVTRYMVDQAKNQDGVNRAMARAFGDHRPASTSVEIVRLATDPRLILELKAVAVVPE